MKLASSLSALLVLGLAPGAAHAFGNANAKVQLHLTIPFTTQVCTRPEVNPSCDQIDTSGDLYPNLYFAHVLITDGSATEGVAGVAFGIAYDGIPGVGVDVYEWRLCAPLELVGSNPSWPAHGSSNLVSWGTDPAQCQRNEPGGAGTGVVAHVGYFYCAAYGASTLQISTYQRPSQPNLHQRVVIANCASQSDVIEDENAPHVPSQLGSVAFSAGGLTEGTNPCQKVVPVSSTSWSRIKSSLIAE